MRVGVNLLWCLPGAVGGSEEYVARQLAGLGDVAPDIHATVFVLPGFAAAHRDVAARHDLVVASLDARRRSRRVLTESTWLPGRLAGADVVHHAGGTVPARSPGPILLTIHDVQYRTFPEYVTPLKRQYLRVAVPLAVRRAAMIAVPSEYVRRTIIEGFGRDPERVVVVPHGVDPPSTPVDADEVCDRYGLTDRRFVVYPAITHPHKNHRFLLELLAGPWSDPDLALVLLGGRGLCEDEVVATIERLGLGPPRRPPGSGACGRPRRSHRRGRGPRVPVGVRGLRCAPARGDGRGHSGRVQRPSGRDGGRRRRWAGAPDRPGCVEGCARRGRRRPRGPRRRRTPPRRAVHDGGVRRCAGRRLPPYCCVPRPRRPSLAARSLALARSWSRDASAMTPMRIVVIGPHFAPDTAPTGRVLTRLVDELAARGHELHVVAALPWYRSHALEPGWAGRLVRREVTRFGTVTRVHPFPGRNKRDLVRRATGFAGFSALAGWTGLGAGGWFRRADAVLAMSPPLTMGVTGRIVAWSHRAPLVFNIQDVFPDAAVETGAITNRHVIAVAGRLERLSYRLADAVTVLSDDLGANVSAKAPRATVVTIPNFVDTDEVRPGDRMTPYRAELGIGDEPVVLYAGNVGLSQSLDLLVEVARRCPDVTVLINGDGAARADLERASRGIPNIRFAGYVAESRLSEVLATGDVHTVPLRPGLGRVSVPSKVYSILAAGRPAVAAIDEGTEVPRLLEASGAGIAVPPDDPDRFVDAVRRLVDDPAAAARMGRQGRDWVVGAASPAAVATSYEALVTALHDGAGRGLIAPTRR